MGMGNVASLERNSSKAISPATHQVEANQAGQRNFLASAMSESTSAPIGNTSSQQQSVNVNPADQTGAEKQFADGALEGAFGGFFTGLFYLLGEGAQLINNTLRRPDEQKPQPVPDPGTDDQYDGKTCRLSSNISLIFSRGTERNTVIGRASVVAESVNAAVQPTETRIAAQLFNLETQNNPVAPVAVGQHDFVTQNAPQASVTVTHTGDQNNNPLERYGLFAQAECYFSDGSVLGNKDFFNTGTRSTGP
jgi:hypothetical protein